MNVEESMDYLRETARNCLEDPYRTLCLAAIENYAEGYGGAKHHHAYKGGLAVHVADVVRRCVELANSETIDMSVLLTAAYWHDHCKLLEYREVKPATSFTDGPEGVLIPAVIGYTDYIKMISHPVGSTYALRDALYDYLKAGGACEAIFPLDKITHCMLSHHGRKEWGSPVEPAANEAWILHAADMMSSRADA